MILWLGVSWTMVSMVLVTCLFYYALEEIHQASTVNIRLNVLKT